MVDETDEITLKSAAYQANLVLDCLLISLTTDLFYRIDQRFEDQKYPRLLAKLDYRVLVDLMNVKYRYFTQHREGLAQGFFLR
jgi:hypothetical protein